MRRCTSTAPYIRSPRPKLLQPGMNFQNRMFLLQIKHYFFRWTPSIISFSFLSYFTIYAVTPQ